MGLVSLLHQLMLKLTNVKNFFFFFSESLSDYQLLHGVFVRTDCFINIPGNPLQVIAQNISTPAGRFASVLPPYMPCNCNLKNFLLQALRCVIFAFSLLISQPQHLVFFFLFFFFLSTTIFYTYRMVHGLTNSSFPCCFPVCYKENKQRG